ncbi:MAG: penicillin-binding protein 1A [Alphaproteobacteria bacterium]
MKRNRTLGWIAAKETMRILKLLLVLASFLLVLGIGGVATAVYGLWHYGKDLPDYSQLADYEPPTATRVHAADGRVIAEYAIENRIFVPAEAIPRRVIEAFISAEDQNFYRHQGVDFIALARAVVTNVQHYLQGRRPIGASTITQQVAKNFLLTNEVSIERKIKEAILAFRIERALSKGRILELYLNEIYLGYGSYGVAAAALNYFDKSLTELTVGEAAYLAALPKAPRNYHPVRKYEAAVSRRNWVIGRMLDEGYIKPEVAESAQNSRLIVVPPRELLSVEARYFVEEVRRELVEGFGTDGVNEGGLSVRTTLDPLLQDFARDSLRQGLAEYDRRHGYRGHFGKIDPSGDWVAQLHDMDRPVETEPYTLAVVLGVDDADKISSVEIGTIEGGTGNIPLFELFWAREALEDQKRGEAISKPSDVVEPGDVILVERVLKRPGREEGDPDIVYPENTFALRQTPEIEGGIVALDPHTGRVLAMHGGWSFERSEFNRATQAKRQPGSAIKPFIYLTALEHGFAPNTMILDAPFVMDQGPGQKKWKPANFSRKFYGPSPMRLGIEKSRNLMTVRLAQAIGMDAVVDTVRRFGIDDNMEPHLAMALGAGETTLLNLTTAYAMLVNGGKRIRATVVDRVQDRTGKTVFQHDQRPCDGCKVAHWEGQASPVIPDDREQLVDPVSAYQIVSMLEGVVQRGTGRSISSIGKPLAGKTGTTNESRDTWFVGFSPDLAVGVFIGFDTPIPLGKQTWGGQETGSSVAAPVFKSFMQKALKNEPAIPFRTPPGVRLVRIDADTGRRASASSQRVIQEAFKEGTAPSQASDAIFIDGGTGDEDATGIDASAGSSPSSSGLY